MAIKVRRVSRREGITARGFVLGSPGKHAGGRLPRGERAKRARLRRGAMRAHSRRARG